MFPLLGCLRALVSGGRGSETSEPLSDLGGRGQGSGFYTSQLRLKSAPFCLICRKSQRFLPRCSWKCRASSSPGRSSKDALGHVRTT